MEGIVVFDYAERYPLAMAEMAQVHEGRPHQEQAKTSSNGIDAFPEALLKLFRGKNFGKLVLQVAQA